MIHLALYQPQVPGNTGNIGRLCVGMGAALDIIGPCAFDLSDKALRRAGLDYWGDLRWRLHPTPEDFLAWLGGREPVLVSKFGARRYDRPAYARDAVIILGNEVRGLPGAWHERWSALAVHIPIPGPVRSYNLANAAAIILAQATLASGGFDGCAAPLRAGTGAEAPPGAGLVP